MTKTFKFHELSTKAQLKAMSDYLKGWEETHEENDLSLEDVQECCSDEEMLYTKTGRYSAQNE